MVNYSNSKIYKLQCDDGYYYIGSTADELRKRLWSHKNNSKTKNSRIYEYINSIGWNRVRIILIEEFSCENKEELLKKEDAYIKEHRNNELCLNMIRAYVTEEEKKEYDRTLKQLKRQDINYIQKEKEYREANKEKIKEYQKEYRLKKK